ncbi:23S rRNA (cytidine(2498)-2'-O)-methyltransferase RlmM [Aestuariibacter halophilus]|uniref:Ribosomal RNA large subunit methyltransferase M n=1 Tax=Fluctibacter halophilus TaxID=226011 RepID=A0ABS8G686_9ALTE|nr:23S rRNA (cytidine(2498)-2'-O)-methyltransferase RlmM [Aestuariibacter halophilus]MCC2616009.1 23S rRNA (cytidine(2498)-2'-O)-methyltransferase RlmM [Aestuariibacter halophilus]
MNSLVAYCRAGFESDTAQEIETRAAEQGLYGYSQFVRNSGFVQFCCYQDEDAQTFAERIAVRELIFARQLFVCVAQLTALDPSDRIGPLLAAVDDWPLAGEVVVEFPDTTEGRELAKFCRKFTVPLRQALRKKGHLTAKERTDKARMHAFFTQSDTVYWGYSLAGQRCPNVMGIQRLKFPSDAPSRSTLKLEEALHAFIPAAQWPERLRPGMTAVDLGACPGGWTYQMVKREISVYAVDNGAMDEALMATGLVSYHAEDGFKFSPPQPVNWLICDMIEQPQRVAELMARWVAIGRCQEAIFNLKLPMKKRYDSVQTALQIIRDVLTEHRKTARIQAKHLYHDREEITVHLRAADAARAHA